MTTIEVVDLTDEARFGQFHEVYRAAFDRDFDQPYARGEKRVNLTDDEYGRYVPLLARDDEGLPVGGGYAGFPLLDNTDLAYVDVFVVPAHRRRGHGSAVLGRIRDLASDAGRARLLGEALWEVGAAGSPGRAFAEAHGFSVGILDAIRDLSLPADVPEAPVADGYRLLGWRTCPDEWLDEYAELLRLILQEAPQGETGLENEYWDGARVRHQEARMADQGRDVQTVVALAPDGTLAGHTQLTFPRDSGRAYQWDTLVLPAHRGHGLGFSLKAEAMRAAADLLADRERVSTWNAAENAPMIAVNESLGYVQTAWAAEYVRDVRVQR